jgi:pyrroline-5-carboxylate reductase
MKPRKMKKISVALIGAGSMGGALLRGWIAGGVIDAATSAVFDPAPRDEIAKLIGKERLRLNPVPGQDAFDALVVAVKPQSAAAALAPLTPLAARASVLSVMAGRSIASIARSLPGARSIIRAMPNLPAAVGAGATALFAPAGVARADRAVAETLMRAIGETAWVDSEAAIDAATAVSGSGPAYFFLLGEALAEAGCATGLSAETSALLARATLVGAGAFAAEDPRTLAELRRAVASPGGTTEAALRILDGEAQEVRKLIKRAVEAAAKRARALTE